ncbi:MAG TPA: hypothetical protein VMM36_12025 [Opitutaceae bacterium]|nr:hypothetical protein [Opitutaceae bacterium]
MSVRFIILALALLASTVVVHATEIVRVWPEWRTDESFVRLSELLGKGEKPGSQIFIRTNPEKRDGLYFLVRLAHASAIEGTLELSLIRPGKMESEVFKFPASVPSGSSVFQLGLTGGDWPDPKTEPVAWRIALVDSSGAEQAAAESFLWSTPQ